MLWICIHAQAGGAGQVPGLGDKLPALRRRADRPLALLYQLRYERALLFDRQGRRALARSEFERLYAYGPGFPGLKQRLGLA